MVAFYFFPATIYLPPSKHSNNLIDIDPCQKNNNKSTNPPTKKKTTTNKPTTTTKQKKLDEGALLVVKAFRP
jgi:hypothetical protein